MNRKKPKRKPIKRLNYHKAQKYTLKKVDRMIDQYPSIYPTPKYLSFIKKMIEEEWKVRVYVSKVSKYVFVEKEERIYKIRFSNHKPILGRETKSDCDFYVGVSHLQVSTTDQILEKILKENVTNTLDK